MLGGEVEADFYPLASCSSSILYSFYSLHLDHIFKACFAEGGEINFSSDHQRFLETDRFKKAHALLLKLRLSLQSPSGCCHWHKLVEDPTNPVSLFSEDIKQWGAAALY